MKSIKLYSIIKNLDKELVKADIYFPSLFSKYTVRTPKISFYFREDKLFLSIENSIRYQEKLDNLDISAALENYVVEDKKMSRNQDRFIYELDDVLLVRRITFSSLEQISNKIDGNNKYSIPIDKKLIIRWSNALIVGATRTGKSYYLYYLIICYLLTFNKENLYMIDPKNSSIAVIGNLVGNVAVNQEESLILLRKFYENMQKRKSELYPKLQNGLDKSYFDFGYPPAILIIDEYATFVSSLKTESKSVQLEINKIIDELILQGSGLGYFVIISMQKSDSTILPTHIRNSLLYKAVLGNAQNTTYITAFEHAQVPNRQLEIGEGFYTWQGYVNEPRYFSVPKLDFDIYQAILRLTNHSNRDDFLR